MILKQVNPSAKRKTLRISDLKSHSVLILTILRPVPKIIYFQKSPLYQQIGPAFP